MKGNFTRDNLTARPGTSTGSKAGVQIKMFTKSADEIATGDK